MLSFRLVYNQMGGQHLKQGAGEEEQTPEHEQEQEKEQEQNTGSMIQGEPSI